MIGESHDESPHFSILENEKEGSVVDVSQFCPQAYYLVGSAIIFTDVTLLTYRMQGIYASLEVRAHIYLLCKIILNE